MKRKLLIIISCTLFLAVHTFAQDLIKDGDFESGVLKKGTVDPNKENGADRGSWYFKTYDGIDVNIIDTETEKGNVARIERMEPTGTSWFSSFLCQWNEEEAKKTQYRLTFKAKKENGAGTVRLQICSPKSSNRFFILKGREFTNDYAAHKEFSFTEEWDTYVVDYDFNYVVNSIYSISTENIETAYTESTEDQLENFYFLFYPQGNGMTVIIDDVTLERYIPSGNPAPAEGPLLVDNDFENVTSIPRKTIKDLDKYSEEMGEWYFYAEPGLPGIDESTAEIVAGEDNYGKSAVLKNGESVPNWWGHTLMQRFSARPAQNIYRISFYAKSAQNAQVTIMVNTKKEGTLASEFILKEGFDATATPTHSGARYDINTTNEWQYYECMFDFSQKCNNYNSPSRVPTYAITTTDEEFLSYCFLTMLNQTENSELLLDNIRIEEIDTYTEIRNPGFENDEAIPVKIQSEPVPGAHSGNWVLVARSQQEGKVSITSDQAYEGEKSMLLNVDHLDEKARYSFYMVMDIYEVPANEYAFSFYAKADKEEVPFRLDAYVYNGNNAQAITGENGDNLTTEGLDKFSAGLKIFQTTSDWTLYSQQMTIPENSMIRLFIRPNINGLGAAGIAEEGYPIKYWFDNFKLEINRPDNITDHTANQIAVTSGKGYLNISNIENVNLSIYDISGVLVDQHQNVNQTIITSLNQGIYIIDITDESGSVVRTKVLVK